mmetsp:Transcript_30624/g.59939  ORF Transcript_30624/g.59939 Transcript_30624/m.59939 type:complete len:80 (-) Transcript_30624:348-587(-)
MRRKCSCARMDTHSVRDAMQRLNPSAHRVGSCSQEHETGHWRLSYRALFSRVAITITDASSRDEVLREENTARDASTGQ